MSKVNIPKTISDPFFRYQRELIKIQIQNNNGGVTKLLNIENIAKSLNIQVKDFLSFLKKKLNVTILEKDFILKKVETVDKLEEFLEEFIKLNVLCPKCNNPEFTETKETVKNKTNKTNNIVRTCKACGNNRIVN